MRRVDAFFFFLVGGLVHFKIQFSPSFFLCDTGKRIRLLNLLKSKHSGQDDRKTRHITGLSSTQLITFLPNMRNKE